MSTFRPAILVAAAAAACSATSAMAQPVEWLTSAGGNGNFFELVTTTSNITWTAARDAAALRTFGGGVGRLADASTVSQDLFVRQLALSTPNAFVNAGSGNSSGPWIGALQPPNSPEPVGGWTWTTGVPWNYTNWDTGEPNNIGNENVIHLFSRGGLTPDQTGWNDLNANSPFYSVRSYVVEYVIPAPSAATLLGLGGLMAARRRR